MIRWGINIMSICRILGYDTGEISSGPIRVQIGGLEVGGVFYVLRHGLGLESQLLSSYDYWQYHTVYFGVI